MIHDHMAHFFMIKSGSKFRDQLAHFFIDIHNGEWVTLEDLKMKRRLKNAGDVREVSFRGNRRVYDLQVSGKNTYIADGFIAKGGDGSIWKE